LYWASVALATLLGAFIGALGSSIWWITGSALIVIATIALAWLSSGLGISGAVLIVIAYNGGLVLTVLLRGVLAENSGPSRRNLRAKYGQEKAGHKK
jgi:hypothetical protein